jgi:hypothetical protein
VQSEVDNNQFALSKMDDKIVEAWKRSHISGKKIPFSLGLWGRGKEKLHRGCERQAVFSKHLTLRQRALSARARRMITACDDTASQRRLNSLANSSCRSATLGSPRGKSKRAVARECVYV